LDQQDEDIVEAEPQGLEQACIGTKIEDLVFETTKKRLTEKISLHLIFDHRDIE
jgi:hypothetical protein